eukprot:TRINITY_DN858_c0_g1_i8.p2 TRINITY_DN858_c0_g1~~TRINITY_DN858_c0_g1_i8.p2  ORF type:complete len:200 (-),score=57.93 TRINITY_DN858_c0_g1_i8:198-797(-)
MRTCACPHPRRPTRPPRNRPSSWASSPARPSRWSLTATTPLYAVTLFRAGVEAFKMGCRDRRYTVREYEFTPTAADDAAEEASRVEAEATSSAAAFGAWTSTAYAEAFMVALHLKVLRVYVESVLRYGLPVDFDVTAVFPAGSKGVSRVRKQLGEMYAHLAGGRGGGGGDAEGVMVPGIVSDKEFFPYVSVDVVMPSAA